MKKTSILVALMLLLMGVIAVVGAQDDMTTLTIGTTDDIAKLDPADAYSFHDWDLLRATGASLLGYVPGSTELQPELAVDFPEVSEDGTVYTFTLRDDILYPDGTQLTAEAYAASINRTIALQGDPVGLVSSIVEAVAVDELVLEITLDGPSDLFLFQAAQPPLIPANPELYAEAEITNFPQLEEVGVVSGVGPYQIVEYVLGEQTVLEANPNWYGGEVGFDRIIFVYYEESAQLDLAIENGEVDIAWRSVSRTEATRLGDLENLELIPLPGRIQYVVFQHDLIDDVNVRRGIATAIDRDELVDRALNGLANPIYSMVPPDFLGSTEAFLDEFGFGDPVAAAEVLAESGYTADNPYELDLWYPPNRYGGEVGPAMELLEQQLEATGAINVTLQSAEWSTYVGAATSGQYPFFFLGWFFDYPDSDNYVQPFAQCEVSTGLGVNFCNDEMDALIAEQRSLVSDPDTRIGILADLQALYASEVVTIPLWVGEDHLLYNTDVVDNVIIGAPLILDYAALTPVGE